MEKFRSIYDIDAYRSAAGVCRVLQNDDVGTKLVAQTYGGGSIMAGELNGIQAKVRTSGNVHSLLCTKLEFSFTAALF